MKQVILIFTFLINFTFAQEPDPYSFFPSAVGNVWEYSTSDGIERYEIISTSVDSNKNKFIYFNFGTYVLDTLFQIYIYPYSLNWLYYKLDADSGDTWIVTKYTDEGELDTITFYKLAKVTNKFQSIIFNQTSTVMEIRYSPYLQDTIFDENYPGGSVDYLASGIGLIQQYDVESGPTMVLRGCIINGDTLGIITTVKDDKELPVSFKLDQNFPNPFNPTTRIEYQLPNAGFVTLKIYNSLGREVAMLINEQKEEGKYSIEFNANDLPSGIYFCQLRVSEYIQVRKMLLIK